MDTDVLIRDYLGRLEAAAVGLPRQRRTELASEVRDHIEIALAEGGRRDEVTVRNVLERLGSPEEIVASEASAAGSRSSLGSVEVAALILLLLAWVALFLPFGIYLWLGFGVVGLVLVWVSSRWSTRRKLITTGVVIAPYAAVFVLFFAAVPLP